MPDVTYPLATPLAELHRASGTAIGTWFGCELPGDFGDWRREYGFLHESVALLDKNYRAYLEFSGPDRVRYLNAILTNNIKDLRENHGIPSLFLSPQGRILAEIETYALPQQLFAVSFAMIREQLIEGLDKYIIMDDVALTDRTADFATLALEGPKTGATLRALANLDLANLADLEFRESSLGSIPCRVTHRSANSADLLVQRNSAPQLWKLLLSATQSEGGGPAGYTALNSRRLEQGIPWFGYDFGEKQIPHEAGLQDSHISYTKGCYTGQEIVERVRSRGQVNRVRVTLQFSGEQTPTNNTPLLADGKEAGFITRAGFSPQRNATLAMAYLRREHSTPGTILQCGDSSATVIAL